MPPTTSEEPGRRWPTPGSVLLAAVIAFAAWFVLATIVRARDLIFLTFLGVLLASILNYPVSFLARWMPRSVASVLVLLGVLAGIAGFFALTIPLLTEQAVRLGERAPEAVERLEGLWREAVRRAPIPETTGEEISSTARQRVGEQAAVLAGKVLPLAVNTLTVVSGVFLLIVLSTFLAFEPRAYVAGILRLVPRRHEATVAELIRRLAATITGWMVGTVIGMAIVGTATALGLLVAGVDSWLVLGLIMFLGEFVPYLGPVAAAIPGVAIGLAESMRTGLWALLVYLIVQQVEGNLVTPLVMRRAVRLPPALLLVWQIVLASAFGFLAILIATPLLACVKVTVDYLYVERILGRERASPA